jgi:adenylate kinase family enzyme
MKLDPPVVLFLDVPDDVARQRMLARRRADDKPETIERRLADYHKELEAIRAAYPTERFIRIDGTKPEAEVAAQIREALSK